MERRKTKAVIIAVCILSIALFAYFTKNSAETVDNTLIGTYKTEGLGATYYVLEDEGNFCKYKQGEVLQEGTYKEKEKAACEIITLDTGETLLLQEKKLKDESGNVYTKFANIPTYINVDAPKNNSKK